MLGESLSQEIMVFCNLGIVGDGTSAEPSRIPEVILAVFLFRHLIVFFGGFRINRNDLIPGPLHLTRVSLLDWSVAFRDWWFLNPFGPGGFLGRGSYVGFGGCRFCRTSGRLRVFFPKPPDCGWYYLHSTQSFEGVHKPGDLLPRKTG